MQSQESESTVKYIKTQSTPRIENKIHGNNSFE